MKPFEAIEAWVVAQGSRRKAARLLRKLTGLPLSDMTVQRLLQGAANVATLLAVCEALDLEVKIEAKSDIERFKVCPSAPHHGGEAED